MWETGQDGKEVVLECLYDLFCSIEMVYMRRHELIRAVVVGNGLAEGHTGLIVHCVHGRCLVGLLEAGTDGLVGGNVVCVLFGGE